MDQELSSLLNELSKEIFHEENFHAAPSAKRIKTAMAAVNKYVNRNLTSNSSRAADVCTCEDGGLFDFGNSNICINCGGTVPPPA